MSNWSTGSDNDKNYILFQEDDISIQLNSVAFGMLMNNSISCLASCSVSQKNNLRSVTYNVSGFTDLRDFLETETTFEFIRTLFINICDAFVGLRRYMINVSDIILELGKVYVDPETADVKFLIDPVWHDEGPADCRSFFRSIIVDLKLSKQDSRHIGPMLALLNKKTFSPEQFMEEIKKIDTSCSPADEFSPIPRNTAFYGGYESEAASQREKETSKADIPDNTVIEEKNKKNPSWIGKIFRKKKQDDSEPLGTLAGLAIPGSENMSGAMSFSAHSDGSDNGVTVMEQNDDVTEILSENASYPKLVNRVTMAVITIDRDIFRIGRDASMGLDFVISSKQVSHHHATIKHRKNMYCIVDENSTNHIYINGKKIPPENEWRLNSGDVIKIGSEEFVFEK